MNEVMNNKLTMTSMEIAGLCGKQHYHVIRDVEGLIKQLHPDLVLGFQSSTYKDATGKSNKCFILDKDSALCLVTGYDVTARMKIIKRWHELEATVARPSSTLDMLAQGFASMAELERRHAVTEDNLDGLAKQVGGQANEIMKVQITQSGQTKQLQAIENRLYVLEATRTVTTNNKHEPKMKGEDMAKRVDNTMGIDTLARFQQRTDRLDHVSRPEIENLGFPWVKAEVKYTSNARECQRRKYWYDDGTAEVATPVRWGHEDNYPMFPRGEWCRTLRNLTESHGGMLRRLDTLDPRADYTNLRTMACFYKAAAVDRSFADAYLREVQFRDGVAYPVYDIPRFDRVSKKLVDSYGYYVALNIDKPFDQLVFTGDYQAIYDPRPLGYVKDDNLWFGMSFEHKPNRGMEAVYNVMATLFGLRYLVTELPNGDYGVVDSGKMMYYEDPKTGKRCAVNHAEPLFARCEVLEWHPSQCAYRAYQSALTLNRWWMVVKGGEGAKGKTGFKPEFFKLGWLDTILAIGEPVLAKRRQDILTYGYVTGSAARANPYSRGKARAEAKGVAPDAYIAPVNLRATPSVSQYLSKRVRKMEASGYTVTPSQVVSAGFKSAMDSLGLGVLAFPLFNKAPSAPAAGMQYRLYMDKDMYEAYLYRHASNTGGALMQVAIDRLADMDDVEVMDIIRGFYGNN